MSGYFDFDLLEALVAVVDAGGITRASERLLRSQPAISLRIKRLEEIVGARLFERKGRRIWLTEDGEKLVVYARQIQALNEEAFSTIADASIQGLVSLGTPSDFATKFLPGVLGKFSKAHPKVQLEVRCESTPHLLRAHDSQELDIVLAKRHPNSELGNPLWKEPLVWVSSQDFEMRPELPLPLVLFSRPCLYRRQVMQSLEEIDRPFRIAYTSPNPVGVWAAVSAGLGLAALPASTLPSDLRIWPNGDELPVLPDIEFAIHVTRTSLTPAGEK